MIIRRRHPVAVRSRKRLPLALKRRMELGTDRSKPTGGTPAPIEVPPARPSVVDEGVEFEVVWAPHRGAASLLGEFASRPDSTHLAMTSTGRVVRPDGPGPDPWEWTSDPDLDR